MSLHEPRLRLIKSPTCIHLTARALAAGLVAVACCLSLCLDVPALAAAKDKKPKPSAVLKGLPITELSEDEAILHALNRLAFGPRPGDIERVRQLGLAKWIEKQLNPESIDDKAVEARLENFPTLKMSSSKLLAEYPQPKQAAKQAGLTKPEFKEQQAEKRRAEAGPTSRGEAAEGPVKETQRSEEHTSELQSQSNLVCRLLLEKKK